jgi:hypothetical protein
MSDDEALTAHGPPTGTRAHGEAARENSRTLCPGDFPVLTEFSKHCYVKSHEDIPRFIQDFFTALCLQYSWVVTRVVIGKTLVSAEDLDNDNAKEQLWMVVHEHESNLLEDTVYRRIKALWSDFSDTYAVFDENDPTQLFCTQKVWEALLDVFPLHRKQMQTILLAREIGNLVAWNGASKRDINNLFKSLNVTRQSFSFMQEEFTIDDVFKTVIMAHSNSLRTPVSPVHRQRSIHS